MQLVPQHNRAPDELCRRCQSTAAC